MKPIKMLLLAVSLGFATPASAQHCGLACQEDQADADRYRLDSQRLQFENQQLEEKLNRQRNEYQEREFERSLDQSDPWDDDEQPVRRRRR